MFIAILNFSGAILFKNAPEKFGTMMHAGIQLPVYNRHFLKFSLNMNTSRNFNPLAIDPFRLICTKESNHTTNIIR